MTLSVTDGAPSSTLPALQPILAMLQQIHMRLTAEDGGPSAATLAALEARYRQTLIEQFQYLTFEGLQPSGVPIALPLRRSTSSSKPWPMCRRLPTPIVRRSAANSLEAEARDPRAREELAMHLDALRAERWNRQARRDMERLSAVPSRNCWTVPRTAGSSSWAIQVLGKRLCCVIKPCAPPRRRDRVVQRRPCYPSLCRWQPMMTTCSGPRHSARWEIF